MEIITVLMTAATVALAGIGGLYYSFACSVMPGLRATGDETFVCSMSRINTAIQNPIFALSFFGAFASLAGAAIFSVGNGLGSAVPVSVALGCYSATLIITFGFSIPLNNRLGRAADAGDAAVARLAFERAWTRWNFHRTWLSLASLVALSMGWASLGRE